MIRIFLKAVLVAQAVSLVLFAPLAVVLAAIHADAGSWATMAVFEVICAAMATIPATAILGEEDGQRKEETQRLLKESGL